MKDGDSDAVAARIAQEAEQFRTMLHSPEAREAFAAFFEKRKPDFGQFG
jgi:enoyl-CoA hydratase/carnithine racemase